MKEQEKLKKVIRNGKVGVLISKGYGAGWYGRNTDVRQCLFSPEIIELVEQNSFDEITNEFCEKLFGVDYFYAGGANSLKIYWLEEGTPFRVNEHDGAESLETSEDLYLIA